MRTSLTATAVAVAPILLLPAESSAQASGYAWADRPSAARYAPTAMYAYSSSGEDIFVVRRGAGSYQVTFRGLGGNGQAGGNVQVTGYGPGSDSCKVEQWDSSAADFVVLVRCFDTTGRPTDSRYSVSVQWPTAPQEQRATVPRPDTVVVLNRRWIDGHVEVEHSDGTVVVECPVGQPISTEAGWACAQFASTHVQYGNLPPLPANPASGTVNRWIGDQDALLLESIEAAITSEELPVFLESESKLNVYQRINWRVRLLAFLLSGGPAGAGN